MTERERVLAGILIKHERLKRNWSLQGACEGICSVSYLSKIEQGKAKPAPEIAELILKRLGVEWHEDEKTDGAVDGIYETVLSGDEKRAEELFKTARLEGGRYLVDRLLLSSWFLQSEPDDFLRQCEGQLSPRQLTLYFIQTNRAEELVRREPSALALTVYGGKLCSEGEYMRAVEALSRAYDYAATEGRAYLMCAAKLLIGNCYSNTMDYERMTEHYAVARRLADAIGDADSIATIDYNIAATALELSRVDEAYSYFSKEGIGGSMSLHKLAICHELRGETRQALNALDRAKAEDAGDIPKHIVEKMLNIVRFRLENPDYLNKSEYGRLLLDCFSEIRGNLPSGYASFHIPWVLEWHRANRQYKQAYELLRDFPEYTNLNAD
ncbi:MAG: helix-turn-helix transcriptional regulator [Clostridia bacterium]|nr:helix-turn-helix transcriptional regulator [Clostridia bacterium]